MLGRPSYHGQLYHKGHNSWPTLTTLMPYFLLDSCKGMWRHQRLPNAFLLINTYRKKIQPRKWSHCVQLVMAHRMIYMMTLNSRNLEVKRPEITWPEANLWPWPLEVNTYMFRCGMTRELRWCFLFCPNLITSKVIRKKLSSHLEPLFWLFSTPVTAESTSKMLQMRRRTRVIAECEADCL